MYGTIDIKEVQELSVKSIFYHLSCMEELGTSSSVVCI